MNNNEAAVQRLLQSGKTHATVIAKIITDTYGEESYDWDPLTVSLEVKADYGIDMPSVTVDKWCAMQIVMGSDAFFKRIDAFIPICNTISSGAPFFSTFDPVTPEEAAWTIKEVSFNRDMLEFSDTISRYVKFSLKSYGDDAEAVENILDPDKISSKYIITGMTELKYQLSIIGE